MVCTDPSGPTDSGLHAALGLQGDLHPTDPYVSDERGQTCMDQHHLEDRAQGFQEGPSGATPELQPGQEPLTLAVQLLWVIFPEVEMV